MFYKLNIRFYTKECKAGCFVNGFLLFIRLLLICIFKAEDVGNIGIEQLCHFQCQNGGGHILAVFYGNN